MSILELFGLCSMAILGLLLLRLAQQPSLLIRAGLVISVFSITLSIAYDAIHAMTGEGINDAVFYHLGGDTEGADLGSFNAIYIAAGLKLLVAIFFLVLVSKAAKFIPINKNQKLAKAMSVGSIIILFSSVGLNPTWADLWKYQLTESNKDLSSFIANPDKAPVNAGKNFIYIYLESFERNYLDQNRFPDLAPFTQALSKQAVDFANIQQTFGASWTIAGMVSSQCGIPLIKPGKYFSSHNEAFLPEAYCMGDILSRAGYSLNYMGGALLEFHSKGAFYRSHGFSSIEGLAELTPYLNDSSYATSWGLYDDSLFPLVAKKYNQLTQQDNPFGLFMLTLDMHPPFDISKSCAHKKYKDGKNELLNAVHCTDWLLQNFMVQIQKNPKFKDTVIIIASDHLGQTTERISNYDGLGRSNLLLMLNTKMPPQTIARPALTLDVGATVLSAIDIDTPALGAGRSLLHSSPTHSEINPAFADVIYSGRNYFHEYWGLPDPSTGITIDPAKQHIAIGKRHYELPLLITVDEKLQLKSLFNTTEGIKTLSFYLSDIPFGERIIWIDSCEEQHYAGLGKITDPKTCMLLLRHGGEAIQQEISKATFINYETLTRGLKPTPHFFDYNRDKNELLNLKNFGNRTINQIDVKKFDYQLTLAASARSQRLAQIHHDEIGLLTTLKEGTQVYGIHKGGQAKSLNLVSCLNNELPLFKQMQNHKNDFEYFIVLSKTTIQCDKASISHFFMGSELKDWSALLENKPYIAILDGTDVLLEQSGNSRDVLVLKIN